MDQVYKKMEEEKRNKLEAEKVKGRAENDAGRAKNELTDIQ